MELDLAALRREYETRGLDLDDLGPDPLGVFDRWFGEVLAGGVEDANAMALATASPEGAPSARTVLLKGYDERGFLFFSNYASRKGEDLARNPRAALLFYWHAVHRQVRVEGRVERASEEESDRYFAARPPGSRLSAAVSPQSQVVEGREWLEARIAELSDRYPSGEVPRPPEWGGYRVVPDTYEFWQGRLNRLHDRFRYRREAGGWVAERLAP